MEPLQITQRSFPFTRLIFTVEGNRELVVEHNTFLRSTREAFPLHLIDHLRIALLAAIPGSCCLLIEPVR